MSVRVTFLWNGQAHANREMAEVPAVDDLVEVGGPDNWYRVIRRRWRKPVDFFSVVDVDVEPLPDSVWPLTTVRTSNQYEAKPPPAAKDPVKERAAKRRRKNR